MTARKAIADSALADELSGPGTNLGSIYAYYYEAKLVACRDLTDDGQPEMVAQLFTQRETSPGPWAIFEQTADGWSLALYRRGVVAELKVSNDGVQEASPGHRDGDPMCCPSGQRSGLVSWDGEEFSYRPAMGSRDRKVAVRTREGARTIAGLNPQIATEPNAIRVFGIPSAVYSNDNWCRLIWLDIGLQIVFVDQNGGDLCDSNGAFVAAIFRLTEAEQAGWEVGGLSVGSSVERMFELYPDAKVGDPRYYEVVHGNQIGKPYVLAAEESPTGPADQLPTFAAIESDGRIVALDLHSRAADSYLR
jgi:hypothetical protein